MTKREKELEIARIYAEQENLLEELATKQLERAKEAGAVPYDRMPEMLKGDPKFMALFEEYGTTALKWRQLNEFISFYDWERINHRKTTAENTTRHEIQKNMRNSLGAAADVFSKFFGIEPKEMAKMLTYNN